MSQERILITGGAGFIGTHALEWFSKEHEVVLLDDFSGPSQTYYRLMEEKLKPDMRIGSVTKPEDVDAAMEDVTTVVHLAAISSVEQSRSDPEGTNRVNVEGTRNILESMRKLDVKRIIFTSSAAVYGSDDGGKRSESDDLKPTSPYGKSKIASEELCMRYGEEHGLSPLVLRPFNAYGPGQSAQSAYAGVIPRFISLVRAGSPPDDLR